MELLGKARILNESDSEDESLVGGVQTWDEMLPGPCGAFVLAVAEHLQMDVSCLLVGHDNGCREILAWRQGERLLYTGNTLAVASALTQARDRAHFKLLNAGTFSRDMNEMLLKPRGMKGIFVRLTATYYAYTLEIGDVREDLATLFRRHPEFRRPLPCEAPPHHPCWVRPPNLLCRADSSLRRCTRESHR